MPFFSYLTAMDVIGIDELDKWYSRPVGRALGQREAQALQSWLARIPGERVLQLGLPRQGSWLHSPNIKQRFVLQPMLGADLQSHFDALPIRSDSIDLVVLPHTLEHADNRADVLAEAARVLAPEGYLIILGFNPISLWGLTNRCRQLFRREPKAWQGKFLTTFSLKRKLNKLNCRTQRVKSYLYRPPVSKAKWWHRLLVLETLGRLSAPFPGGAFMLVAQKQTLAGSAVQVEAKPWRKLEESAVPQPTTCGSD